MIVSLKEGHFIANVDITLRKPRPLKQNSFVYHLSEDSGTLVKGCSLKVHVNTMTPLCHALAQVRGPTVCGVQPTTQPSVKGFQYNCYNPTWML